MLHVPPTPTLPAGQVAHSPLFDSVPGGQETHAVCAALGTVPSIMQLLHVPSAPTLPAGQTSHTPNFETVSPWHGAQCVRWALAGPRPSGQGSPTFV